MPQIPQPQATVGSLAFVAQFIKQAIDSLAGRVGSPTARAVTFDDLISLSVITQLQAQSLNGEVVRNAAVGVEPYEIAEVAAFTSSAALAASEIILVQRIPTTVVFPANFNSVAIDSATWMQSFVGSLVGATGASVLNIQKCLAAADPTVGGNWTTIGTASFAAGAHSATLATSGGSVQPFLRGDFIRIIAPAVPDATLAQVFCTLIGTR